MLTDKLVCGGQEGALRVAGLLARRAVLFKVLDEFAYGSLLFRRQGGHEFRQALSGHDVSLPVYRAASPLYFTTIIVNAEGCAAS